MLRRSIAAAAATALVLGSVTSTSSLGAGSPGPATDLEPLIVYQGDGALHTVRPDGSHDRRLGDLPTGAQHMDWSPDGRRLAFEAYAADGLTGDIWVSDADGSDARMIADCQAPCAWFGSPAWSPNGRSIAYTRYDVSDGHFPGSILEILDLDTSSVTSVAPTTTPEFTTDVRWSPDGTHLVLTIQTFVDPDHSNDTSASRLAIAALAKPEAVRDLVTVDRASYSDWHATEDLILFQAGVQDPEWLRAGRLDLYTVRPDGSGLTRLRQADEADPVVWMPTWSADGHSILVTLTDRSTGDHTIGRLSRDGGTLERLPGPIHGAHPRQARVVPDP